MSDLWTGVIIGTSLIFFALAIPVVMEIYYHRRERKDGKR